LSAVLRRGPAARRDRRRQHRHGPFGNAAVAVAGGEPESTPRQIVAVSGITTLPLVLLTNQPNVRTIADFKPADRIAVPTSSSPQMYLLQMQSEKIFGQYDRLRSQIVILSHPDAVAALVAGTDRVAGYFSSAPYTQIALADGRVHKVLSSADVIGGKASFLIMGASRGYVAAHPQTSQAVVAAMDEAAHIIRDNPRRAAAKLEGHRRAGAPQFAEHVARRSRLADNATMLGPG